MKHNSTEFRYIGSGNRNDNAGANLILGNEEAEPVEGLEIVLWHAAAEGA
jgi:hypothetical protein